MGSITSTISSTSGLSSSFARRRHAKKNSTPPRSLRSSRASSAAQRGLREASDAEAPYAMSERSRRHNGFSPAKPESQVASTNKPLNPPARQATSNRTAQTNLLGSEGDDQGEPIRLASGEAPSSNELPPQTNISPRSTQTTNMRSRSDQPARLPEIPKLPILSQLPDPPDAGPMPGQRGVPVSQAAASQEPTTAQQNAMPQRVAVAEISQPPVLTPAPAPAVEPPHEQGLDKELVLSPVPTGGTPAPNTAATTPLPAPLATPAPSSGGLVQPSDPSLTSKAAPNPTAINLETISSQTPASGTAQPTLAGGLDHKESEDATRASMPSPAPDASTTVIPGPEPVVPKTDELPPLPPDVSRTATLNHASETAPAPIAAPTPGAAAPDPANDLPPLPAELSRIAVSSAAPDAAKEVRPLPVEVSRIPTTNSAADAANELPPLPAELGRTATPNSAPEVSSVPTAAPTSQPAEPGAADALQSPVAAAHTEEESVPPVSGGNEVPSIAITSTGEGQNVDSGTTVALPQSTTPAPKDPSGSAATGAPEPSPEPTDPKLPVLPTESSGIAAPTGQPLPTTNPNLGREPAAAAASRPLRIPHRYHRRSNTERRLRRAQTDSSPVSPPPRRRSAPSCSARLKSLLGTRMPRCTGRRKTHRSQWALLRDTISSDLRTQTQLDISRAPSPAEARPIKAIPVPEDWVALPPRNWSPQRKFWAAAATCHLPLYFQDPVLERYGHSVEQFVGPVGRYLTYPVDDPTQSIQRNQIVQPFFSAGLFMLQIAALPYNLIMDPPWEAQYDLGYYRPGDNIPTDTYWLPLHGYGPPLHGSQY